MAANARAARCVCQAPGLPTKQSYGTVTYATVTYASVTTFAASTKRKVSNMQALIVNRVQSHYVNLLRVSTLLAIVSTYESLTSNMISN